MTMSCIALRTGLARTKNQNATDDMGPKGVFATSSRIAVEALLICGLITTNSKPYIKAVGLTNIICTVFNHENVTKLFLFCP
mmetsp:Transcript_30539/g.63723  ORF Transcript_30539/g.63723 Transcript_30539/m.63723 type:complete len:82 (-) Transcript_30539:2021-2266(-)